MPIIRPITDLRDTNAISDLCHSQQEPVFITKNGYDDLVVMSIDTYERQMALLEVSVCQEESCALGREKVLHLSTHNRGKIVEAYRGIMPRGCYAKPPVRVSPDA